MSRLTTKQRRARRRGKSGGWVLNPGWLSGYAVDGHTSGFLPDSVAVRLEPLTPNVTVLSVQQSGHYYTWTLRVNGPVPS